MKTEACAKRRRAMLAIGLFAGTAAVLLMGLFSERDPARGGADDADITTEPGPVELLTSGTAPTGNDTSPTRPDKAASKPPDDVRQVLLRGIVVDAETGIGVANARVYRVDRAVAKVSGDPRTDGSKAQEARSNEHGEFELTLPIDGGDTRLGVLRRGYRAGEVQAADVAKTIVDQGAPLRIELLPARGTIRGRVVDEQNTGLPNATVWCRAVTSRVTWERRESRAVGPLDAAPWLATTDASGRFELSGLPVEVQFIVMPRLVFHAPLDGKRRTFPDRDELVIRMQRVGIIAWRFVRDGKPVPPNRIAALALHGRLVNPVWPSALPLESPVEALYEKGYCVQMLAAGADPDGTGAGQLALHLTGFPHGWISAGATIRGKLGALKVEDQLLPNADLVKTALEAAFVGGLLFDGRLAFTTGTGEHTSVRVRGGRASFMVPSGIKRLGARVFAISARWWDSSVKLLGGGPLGRGPLLCQVSGGRVDLEVLNKSGVKIDTFDLEVYPNKKPKHGWMLDYVRRLEKSGEAKPGERPYVWLAPGTHYLRVNHARLGFAEAEVAVPADGSAQSVRLVLDPARAIDLTTKPR